MTEGRIEPDGPAGQGEAADVGGPAVDHDPTGLDLARAVAGSIGAGRRRRRVKTRRESPGPQASGAHPDGRDPKKLGDALEGLVESRGWTTEIGVHTLLARWSSLVGGVNAAHSHPEAYADGVVTVRADSSVWATSLRSFAPQLVAELNRRLGDGSVRRVHVLGPEAPTWKHGQRSVRDGRGPRDTYG